MVFVLLPGHKYMLQGRGFEAVLLTGLGSLGGLAVLVAGSPLALTLFSKLHGILAAHLGWILAAIVVFLILSEWPKAPDRRPGPFGRLAEAWTGLGAGLLTFVLSGMLGLVLMYRSPLPAERAFQNLLPAFAGLFALPWVLFNLVARGRIPRQQVASSLDVTPGLLARGLLAGALGGSLAAFFPAVSGGLGGLLAGHATAQRDDRLFIISQGASKVVYYVGGLVLFFIPGLGMTRGGMAWLLSATWQPGTPSLYFTAMAAIILAGTLAFWLLPPLTRLVIMVIERASYRAISAVTLAALVGLVLALTGWGGLPVMLAATGIGLIPAAWGSRRLNCMGIVLLPISLNLAGVGPAVAGWLGLI